MVKYILGHKNPDTDSICSAIVYRNFLKIKGIEGVACKLGELNCETKYVLEKLGAEAPLTVSSLEKGSEVVLVDHNEKSQTIDNIDELNIVEVIDHHKFNLITSNPVFIRAEPIGSTCTVIAKMMYENNYEISHEDAILLISGIISDTLYFRSPTSTSDDKEIMLKLNEIAKIEDLEKYSLEMFDAKSDLGDISVEDLIKLDYKVFDFNGKKFGIGVMETTNPNFGLNKKDEIVSKLKEMKQSDGLNCVFLSIIDILKEENLTIFPGDFEKDLLVRVFDAKIDENGIAHLGSIVSRKKQIAPKIESFSQ